MGLVDSHCHLPLISKSPEGMDIIVSAAKNEGVEHILSVSIDLETSNDVLESAKRYHNVSASVGVHPNCGPENSEPSPDTLIALGSNEEIIAIGETGLDFFFEGFDVERQIRQLKAHISAARELKKPLIIHCREAAPTLLPILKSEKADEIGGIMHCFVDDWDVASEAMDLGFLISFSGIVTFKNAEKLRKVARKIPADKILVETDAPWLAPVPNRGKENQPAFVCHTAKLLSELRNQDFNEFSHQTSLNFYNLFRLKPVG